MKRLITLCLLGGCFLSAPAQNYVSQAWVADQGNGTYKNPVLYADYSDPDVCRVGDDYYLTSSSFNCLPGLQILHSMVRRGSVVVSFLFGALFFREKNLKSKAVDLILVLIGMFFLYLGSK